MLKDVADRCRFKQRGSPAAKVYGLNLFSWILLCDIRYVPFEQVRILETLVRGSDKRIEVAIRALAQTKRDVKVETGHGLADSSFFS
jgi:hypothetical protein